MGGEFHPMDDLAAQRVLALASWGASADRDEE
jgi:hypothetical protein